MKGVQRTHAHVVIVGAGAAGLATAIFATRGHPNLRVTALDSAKNLGAKILISGGGRCNVTNVVVGPDDYQGGSRHTIKKILNAFSVSRTIAFFQALGVDLYEDYAGKLFPRTDRARSVLDALLNEADRLGVQILTDQRVTGIQRSEASFEITTVRGVLRAPSVVLATGGLSLPKTGSDGAGYAFAKSLGHTIVPTTPALVPLVLSGDFHTALAGISCEAELIVRIDGQKPVRMCGALLWTHFGISGPVVLDISRFWHRAMLEKRCVSVEANFLPGETFESAEQRWISLAGSQPRAQLETVLATFVPARLGRAILSHLNLQGRTLMSHVVREERRKLLRALLAWQMPVSASRGYGHAEVTAGGVPLDEIDSATMGSRRCAGLYLVGEILDCEGRIGGFNFQWAWSTGWVAGQAIARAHDAGGAVPS